MSDREWRFYLQDMLRFAQRVRAYSSGLDRAAFEQDEFRYDAILRNLLHECDVHTLLRLSTGLFHVQGVAVLRQETGLRNPVDPQAVDLRPAHQHGLHL